MKAYVCFDVTHDDSGSVFFVSLLRRLFPPDNPALDDLYNRVTTFHVELDSETGTPLREIGFDSDGRLLVIAPRGNNRGCVVDSNCTLDPAIHVAIGADQFEREWNAFDDAKVT